jgi:hypothetical protein
MCKIRQNVKTRFPIASPVCEMFVRPHLGIFCGWWLRDSSLFYIDTNFKTSYIKVIPLVQKLLQKDVDIAYLLYKVIFGSENLNTEK